MSVAVIAVRDEAAALLPLLYSNRSAAYISLGRFTEARADATKTVELRSDWSKAYNRLAVANIGLGRFDDAFPAIRKGLEIEPENVYIMSTLVHALEHVLGKMTVSEMIMKLQRDAGLADLFVDQEFFSTMKKLHGNPKSIQLYLSDQRMMRGLELLLNVKIGPQQGYCTSQSSKGFPVNDHRMDVGDLLAMALQEKDAGNDAYKKEELETAIMHYSHGLELVSKVLDRSTINTTARGKDTSIMEDNEIRVSLGGKFQSYITYANHLLQDKGSDEVIFKAVGDAISKAVLIVEQFKREIMGLHQNTAIRSIDVEDRLAPLQKDFTLLVKLRRVPMIIITLSRKPLDISSPGYQPPFSTGQMNHKDFSRGDNSPASGNRSGIQCMNNYRSSNRYFSARGGGVQGRRTECTKEGNGIVEPRSSYVNNHRSSNRYFSARGRGVQGGRKDRTKEGSGIVERGSSCMNNYRSSNINFSAQSGGVQVRRKDGTKEGIGIVEPRSSCNDNSIILDDDNDEDGGNGSDNECVILDTNPFEEITTSDFSLSDKDRNKVQFSFSLQQCVDEDELSVTAQRGQIACRDYPHARHLCGVYPFSTTPHQTYCSQCYCYVCEEPAPCKDWNAILDKHCNATECDPLWKKKRDDKRGPSAYKPDQNHWYFDNFLLS